MGFILIPFLELYFDQTLYYYGRNLFLLNVSDQTALLIFKH